jgi:hypothetical protein
MTFTTRSLVHPRLSLRYDWDHIFNRAAASELETRDQRIQAQLDHTLRRHTFLYSYTHRKTENVVTEIKSTEDAQVFRYESPIFRPGKLTASTTYTFNHRDQAQERVGGGKILTVIPGAAGLYAEDTSPEFDPLGNVPSLTDLNTADPTVPPIDIGGALIFRNLGLDLGFEQPVTVIYVYTDRPSGLQPSWDVFVSRDNLEWDVWEGTPTVTFNADLSRYEIAFPTVATRFVKVVNTGGNEIPEVLVTELEGLAEAELEGKVTRRGSGHRLDLGANYDFTERVSSSLDASYEYDPFSGFSGDRQRGDYTLGAEYRMTRAILHHLRWQQGYHSFADNTVEELNRTASYTLLVEPIETLRFTTSLDSRLGHRNGAKTGEFRGVVFRVFGTPVRRANLSADVNRSRTEQHDVGRLQDTWNFRISGDGAVTRSLNAILTYSHQRVTSQPGNELRVRNRYSINFDWRATRTIFARGTYNLVRELTDETSQDYLLSWNVAPKLALSGQGTFLKTQQDKYTERYNANLTYNLTARSTVYSSYTFTDFTQVGGVESVSFQLGLRAAL